MNPSLARRLQAHFRSAATLAVVGGLGAAAPAPASVVYSGVVNISVPRTTQGIYLNLVTGVNNTVPASAPGWDINVYGAATMYLWNNAPQYQTIPNGTNVALLAAGDAINSTTTVTTTSVNGQLFPIGSPGLYGFRFQDEASGNALRWGWARVINTSSGTYTVVDYAYENSGAGILAGDTGQSACYANCDASTSLPFLNVQDFTCFLQKFAAADAYANCDASTTAPTLNVQDFTCFLQKFAAGCSAP